MKKESMNYWVNVNSIARIWKLEWLSSDLKKERPSLDTFFEHLLLLEEISSSLFYTLDKQIHSYFQWLQLSEVQLSYKS
jgi:hypothetical protein